MFGSINQNQSQLLNQEKLSIEDNPLSPAQEEVASENEERNLF
jgi:hypothetical protein